MALRIVMMGTGGFALPTFRALLHCRHPIVALFTQPDRVGRGHHRHLNPLKELAVERGIPVFQPEKANLPEPIGQLRSLSPDLCVVAAYGQILSAELLAVPKFGAINIHASLLPKYRGAAPIQTAVLRGEHETGITIFQIEPKLDAGPILATEKTPIGPKETSGELEARLAEIGAKAILPLLDQIEAGTVVGSLQDASQVSRAPRLQKESGHIDWSQNPREIDCHVRAMQPWPLADTYLSTQSIAASKDSSQRLIILDIDPAPVMALNDLASMPANARPGTILTRDRKRLIVQTGAGPIEILRLRPDGKRSMTAAEFLVGNQVEPGDWFTPRP